MNDGDFVTEKQCKSRRETVHEKFEGRDKALEIQTNLQERRHDTRINFIAVVSFLALVASVIPSVLMIVKLIKGQ
ncbi:hypothetical protein ACFL3R_00650 [Thermodesulfobacteriota bacterium]